MQNKSWEAALGTCSRGPGVRCTQLHAQRTVKMKETTYRLLTVRECDPSVVLLVSGPSMVVVISGMVTSFLSAIIGLHNKI